MTPARQGLKTTSDLRSQIADAKQQAEAAEKTRKDEDYALNSSKKGLDVLAKIPAATASDPALLSTYLKDQITAEKLKPKGTSADLPGLYQLQKTMGERAVTGGVLGGELQNRRDEAEAKLGGLTDDAAKKKKALEDLQAQYKAYTDLVPEKELTRLFEKDRTASTPRLIEQELAVLREKLKSFPPQPPTSTFPCPAREALKKFVKDLEEEVDKLAHRAKCHKCDKENGVDRTPEAKDLINAKVAELEQLAKRDNDTGLTPEQKTDYALAKALESMRTAKDENGKTAGKMLGVLVCKTPTGDIVHIYGYSGTLGAHSRIAEAEVAKIQRQLDIPGNIVKKQTEVDANKTAITEAEKRVTAATEAAKGKDQKSDEAKALSAEKAELGRLRQKEKGLAKELETLEATRPKNLDELSSQLAAAKEKAAEASRLDTAVEDSTTGSWVRSLPPDGVLQSAGGDIVSLEALNKDHSGTPHGVCSAPKMIQEARNNGYEILGMAEAWYGGDPNPHGELVASCTTCMKNIGFQFCDKAKHG